MRLYAEPINSTPGIPSVILTVNRVDQFLSNTGSFSGSFTGSFSGNGAGLTNIPSSGIVGLNLSRIATGSVTASVSLTNFTVSSGSTTEFTVTGTGVNIGSIVTDTHTITGSLIISGSITGSLFGTSSFATSASRAISSSFATTASYALSAEVTIRRSDYTSSLDPNINLLYLGEAPNNSSESANVWNISRLSISSSGTVVTRTTSSAAWTSRYTYTYL
jgi:hypothetical protein